jgi:CDP-glucose 4,6-dehydratase
MGGHDPYSSSKGCAELITPAYIRSFFSEEDTQNSAVRVASTRAGNVIGGGDWAQDRLIPDIIKSIIDRKPVLIRAPYAIRPWQHVLEPLRGYLILAENLWNYGQKFVGGWNFGSSDQDAQPVHRIADTITKLWGQYASWESDTQPHPHEATYLKLDCSKARALLKWAPQLNLQQSLEWIVEWYLAYAKGADMRSVTHRQIRHYESLFGKQA